MGEKRFVVCPLCKGNFPATLEDFDEVETRQGGKNKFCPLCGRLLWISFKTDLSPVPLPTDLREKIDAVNT